jgi:hypothetical protein
MTISIDNAYTKQLYTFKDDTISKILLTDLDNGIHFTEWISTVNFNFAKQIILCHSPYHWIIITTDYQNIYADQNAGKRTLCDYGRW